MAISTDIFIDDVVSYFDKDGNLVPVSSILGEELTAQLSRAATENYHTLAVNRAITLSDEQRAEFEKKPFYQEDMPTVLVHAIEKAYDDNADNEDIKAALAAVNRDFAIVEQTLAKLPTLDKRIDFEEHLDTSLADANEVFATGIIFNDVQREIAGDKIENTVRRINGMVSVAPVESRLSAATRALSDKFKDKDFVTQYVSGDGELDALKDSLQAEHGLTPAEADYAMTQFFKSIKPAPAIDTLPADDSATAPHVTAMTTPDVAPQPATAPSPAAISQGAIGGDVPAPEPAAAAQAGHDGIFLPIADYYRNAVPAYSHQNNQNLYDSDLKYAHMAMLTVLDPTLANDILSYRLKNMPIDQAIFARVGNVHNAAVAIDIANHKTGRHFRTSLATETGDVHTLPTDDAQALPFLAMLDEKQVYAAPYKARYGYNANAYTETDGVTYQLHTSPDATHDDMIDHGILMMEKLKLAGNQTISFNGPCTPEFVDAMLKAYAQMDGIGFNAASLGNTGMNEEQIEDAKNRLAQIEASRPGQEPVVPQPVRSEPAKAGSVKVPETPQSAAAKSAEQKPEQPKPQPAAVLPAKPPEKKANWIWHAGLVIVAAAGGAIGFAGGAGWMNSVHKDAEKANEKHKQKTELSQQTGGMSVMAATSQDFINHMPADTTQSTVAQSDSTQGSNTKDNSQDSVQNLTQIDKTTLAQQGAQDYLRAQLDTTNENYYLKVENQQLQVKLDAAKKQSVTQQPSATAANAQTQATTTTAAATPVVDKSAEQAKRADFQNLRYYDEQANTFNDARTDAIQKYYESKKSLNLQRAANNSAEGLSRKQKKQNKADIDEQLEIINTEFKGDLEKYKAAGKDARENAASIVEDIKHRSTNGMVYEIR